MALSAAQALRRLQRAAAVPKRDEVSPAAAMESVVQVEASVPPPRAWEPTEDPVFVELRAAMDRLSALVDWRTVDEADCTSGREADRFLDEVLHGAGRDESSAIRDALAAVRRWEQTWTTIARKGSNGINGSIKP